MRILQVINSMDPAGGGPAETAVQIAAHFRDYGHTAEILSLDHCDFQEYRNLKVKINCLGPAILKRYFCFSWRLAPYLKRRINEFDCVIIHGIWRYVSFGTWLALRKSGKPYFVFTHGMLDPYFKKAYPFKHLRKWLYWPWADYRVLRDAKAVLFTSEEERLLARKSFWLYKANEEVLAYGIAPNTGNVEQQKNIFLSQFPVLKGKRLIFFLGRLHPKKGCDLLIKAFSALAHRDNNLHLVMAGPDQIGWKKKLEKIAGNFGIADKVCWTGMISHDLVWGGLNCAEVFILPSHQENFGISVAQAISCGVPVLITDKVNIWREIDNFHAGFVGRDDLAGVTDLLKRWLDLTEDQKAALRENARRCFIDHFRIDKTMQGLAALLKRYGVKDA